MSDLEKTEHPTPRRIDQAREEGNVPRSRELAIFSILLLGFAGIWGLSSWFYSGALKLFNDGLRLTKYVTNDGSLLMSHMGDLFLDGLILCLPIFMVLIIASFVSPLALKSIIFSTKALMPNFGRLNPVAGIKRIFSVVSLVELLKAILKTMMLGGIGLILLWKDREEMIHLGSEDVYSAVGHSGSLVMYAVMVVVSSLVVLVLIDVPFQLWNYYDKLKMTIEEVKKEMKEMEGNPHVKAKRRSMAGSRGRQMNSVPDADVIVTNPTHYAVALKYKEGMDAPLVLAMGVDNTAAKIRSLAKENKIRIIEAPPLARALYKYAEVDREIPHQFYKSVAEVLGYVYQLKNWEQKGGAYPMPPDSFFVNEFNV